ncbi:MAG TPA: coproporphyrinogen dehydrogenase HemZ [Lachnospiraceae bacterium]|nr:coproporphyrinogen dehydrogenase HemZ [Lachnospiraceae bacterium]
MITIEIKGDAVHNGGEFAYDLKTLANSFYPDRDCEVVPLDEWMGRSDYPIRITYNDKVEFETELSPYDKESVKREVYRFFSKRSHSVLPWGILTGIRPAKIATKLLRETNSRQESFEVLMDDYLVYPEKAELVLDVAVNEHHVTKDLDLRNGYSVYVGIPFCPSICQYCTFSSYPVDRYTDRIGDYLGALEKEMGFNKRFVNSQRSKRKLHSIYVGGGTPTSLDEKNLQRLMEIIRKTLPMDEVIEFTVEAGRPDSITREKLEILKEFGVNRVSINPQSMLQDTLQRLGRTHTVEQVREAFRLAREVGFENINMDLIVGLPEEDEVDFYNTLNQVYDLGPDSITVHTLVIKRASRLRREQMETGGFIRPEETLIPVLQKGSYDYLKQHGYEPYYMYRQKNTLGATRNTNQENVAYARLGKECLYNIFMMEELEDIIAYGAAGSSKHMVYAEGESGRSDAAGDTGIPLTASANMTYEPVEEDEYETARFGRHFPHESIRMERIENVKSVEDYISRIDEMIERKEKIWH